MKHRLSDGFTVPELIVTIVIFAIVASSTYLLLIAHISASSNVQMRAASLSLATEQMEYLRSLPYDSLAIQGGSITTSATPMPGTVEQTRAGRVFQIITDIRYADDAFDGCLNYGGSQATLCRNYKVGTVLSDTNPRDYKVADIVVRDKATGKQFATLSSQFTSRVAETAGNSSAVLTTILDGTGSPVSGATVRIQNSTTSPTVDQTATTDVNGVALFLDVVPDNGPDYVVSATKSGYSSLSTIAASGSLTPTYPNVTAIVQQVSSVTLKIDLVSSDSLLAQTVDATGATVPNMQFVIRGGIKLYTDPADTTYSYQQTVTTDATGTLHIASLTPGDYQVCYNAQPNPCSSSHTRKLVVLKTAYGQASHQPFSIPAGTSSVVDGGPMQRIILMTSTASNVPRITTISPTTDSASATDAGSTDIQIDGANLSGATVKVRQGAVVITGTILGTDTATSIKRELNLSGVAQGAYEVIVTNAFGEAIQTGVAPGTLGGINVVQ